jgi:hypothetical protein
MTIYKDFFILNKILFVLYTGRTVIKKIFRHFLGLSEPVFDNA